MENVKKCNITEVLPASVIQLIRVAPVSTTTRALVMAQIKQPIPDGIQSYEAIKDWIEHHIAAPVKLKPGMPKAPPANNRINVPIIGRQDSRGTCNYVEHQKGDGNYELMKEELVDMASDSEDSDQFLDRVRESMAEDWDDCIPPVVQQGREYENHEQDHIENSEVEIKSEGYEVIKAALREHIPEEYDRLFN